MFIVLGVIERDHGTLYCTVIFVDPAQGLVAKHRKLIPTAMERVIWGQGDASTLAVVNKTFASSRDAKMMNANATLTAAICW